MNIFQGITDKLFLVKQKSILEKELVYLEERYKMTRQFVEYGNAEDEKIQEMEEMQENIVLQQNLKNLIKETKDALKRIESGKYGTCTACDGEIEVGRLKAYPSAWLCSSCAPKKSKK